MPYSNNIPIFDENKILGFGSFGTVYSGLWNEDPAAVKKIPLFIKNESQLSSIEKEALIQKQLNHEHIVRLFDFSKDEFDAYLIFELMEYGELFDIIKNTRIPLGSSACVTIGKDIVAGLAYMHEKGFLHRDIKPENIVFNRRMQAKITDLGFACAQTKGETSSLVGTQHALAPELVSSHQYNCINYAYFSLFTPKKYQYSPASDVFAFGILLLMIMCRTLPYRDSGNLWQLIIGGAYTKIPSETSPLVAKVISGCLVLNPAERMETKEIIELFSSYVAELDPTPTLSALSKNIELDDEQSAQIIIALNKISLFVADVFHPIHHAAREGMLEIIKKLIERDPELLHVKDSKNQTPLLWAVSAGHDKVADFFIAQGANVNTATEYLGNYHNYSPLDWAIDGEHETTKKTLIAAGAKANNYCGECKLGPRAKNSHVFFKLPKSSNKEEVNVHLNYSGQLV